MSGRHVVIYTAFPAPFTPMIKALAVFSVLTLLGLAPLSADLAPTQFIGSGIVPQTNTVIRMEKANVEIVWGTPCALVATFTMVNPSADTQTLEVGFPITRHFPFGLYKPGMEPEPLSMAFDGTEAAIIAPPVQLEDDGNQVWYRCTHAFKPGKTVVTVKTILPASDARSGPFQESLFYTIETGGPWAGTIGEETVTIRFPHPLYEHQIVHASPTGHQVEGSSIRWRLVDIEPRGKEFDIHLTYVRPDAMHFLHTLRQELARYPEDFSLAIKLARNLAILGNPKSNASLPSRLPEDIYKSLLSKIEDRQSQELLADHYVEGHDGIYRLANAHWPEASSLAQILANAGYRDEASKSVFVREAEELLKDVLKRDPHNAEAWNVYLANYWRFSFVAVGTWFGSWHFSAPQIRAIESAARNCPDDECIQDWLKLRQTPREKMDQEPLKERIKAGGYYDVDFPFLAPERSRLF